MGPKEEQKTVAPKLGSYMIYYVCHCSTLYPIGFYTGERAEEDHECERLNCSKYKDKQLHLESEENREIMKARLKWLRGEVQAIIEKTNRYLTTIEKKMDKLNCEKLFEKVIAADTFVNKIWEIEQFLDTKPLEWGD